MRLISARPQTSAWSLILPVPGISGREFENRLYGGHPASTPRSWWRVIVIGNQWLWVTAAPSGLSSRRRLAGDSFGWV